MRKIDITPTFAESATMLIAILENGTPEGKDFAKNEIRHWAAILDGLKKEKKAAAD